MKRNEPVYDVPSGRRSLHIAAQVVGLVGLLLFGSTFVSFAMDFGEFGNFGEFEDRSRSMMLRIFAGTAMMIVSGAMANVAARGLAGSGVVLDPRRARRDLEPWSRLQGGVLNDVIDEIPGVGRAVDRLGGGDATDDGRERPVEVVRVRCPGCRALNDEGARFCSQCGAGLL